MLLPNDFEDLHRQFSAAAFELENEPDSPEGAVYLAMAREPGLYLHWWSGALCNSAAESSALAAAGRAYAHGKPIPELSPAQRGRFALRLRLASRILRSYGSKNTNLPAAGWFPTTLGQMERSELCEWLLVDAAEFLLEVLDEGLLWAEDHGP